MEPLFEPDPCLGDWRCRRCQEWYPNSVSSYSDFCEWCYKEIDDSYYRNDVDNYGGL
jgi:hypothetical protein